MDSNIWDEKKTIEAVGSIVNNSEEILKAIEAGNLSAENLNKLAVLEHEAVMQLATLIKATINYATDMRDLFYRLKHSHDTAKLILKDRISEN